MSRLPDRFDERCPCKKDCAKRSAECRKTCTAYKEYEAEKTVEYAERKRVAEEKENRYMPTAGLKRALRHVQRERQRGKHS